MPETARILSFPARTRRHELSRVDARDAAELTVFVVEQRPSLEYLLRSAEEHSTERTVAEARTRGVGNN